MNKILLIIGAALLLVSCASKTPKIKSPCVSNDLSGNSSPCIRRPVNTWLA